MTVLDIINMSLRMIGANAQGETASSQEAADALVKLNMIIGQWNNEKLMVYSLENNIFNIQGGKSQYLIGKMSSVASVLHDGLSGAFSFSPKSGAYTSEQSVQLLHNGAPVGDPASVGSYTEVVYTVDGSLPAIASLQPSPQTSPITNGQLYTGPISPSQFAAAQYQNADGTYSVVLTLTIWGGGISAYTTYRIALTLPDFIGNRPDTLELGAFIRDNLPGYFNDYKLELIPSNRYQEIYQKQLQTTYPQYLWYLPSLPYGIVTIWPVPIRSMQLNLAYKHKISSFSGVNDSISLPDGYDLAMAYALAVHLCPEYGIVKPSLKDEMLEAKANLMRTNTETLYLSTDLALFPNPPRSFNIFGGRP